MSENSLDNKEKDFFLKVCVDIDAWDALVRESQQGHVFSRSSFLRSLNCNFACYEVMNKNKETVAGVVVIEESGRMAQAPFMFCPHQGVIFSRKISDLNTQKRIVIEYRITDFLIQNLLKIYKNFSMSLSPFVKDLRPYLWHNYGADVVFDVRQKYTAHLSLVNFDLNQYLNKIRAVRRQEYKKSNSIITKSDNIDLFLNMYVKTFDRQLIEVNDGILRIVRDICMTALREGYGYLSCAMVDGRAASMSFILLDESCAYYLFGVNDPEMRRSNASTKLMIENLVNLAAQGVGKFDFVGVNSPQRGDYKLSFGPELVPYQEVHLFI